MSVPKDAWTHETRDGLREARRLRQVRQDNRHLPLSIHKKVTLSGQGQESLRSDVLATAPRVLWLDGFRVAEEVASFDPVLLLEGLRGRIRYHGFSGDHVNGHGVRRLANPLIHLFATDALDKGHDVALEKTSCNAASEKSECVEPRG